MCAGLRAALEAQGKTADAADVSTRFDRAWARADMEIATSCLCVPRLSRK